MAGEMEEIWSGRVDEKVGNHGRLSRGFFASWTFVNELRRESKNMLDMERLS